MGQQFANGFIAQDWKAQQVHYNESKNNLSSLATWAANPLWIILKNAWQ